MRVIVFFDLPSVTLYDKKQYRKFRKFLVTEGFIMMQQSVYSKIVLNNSVLKAEVKKIKEKCPSKGIVEILTITEKQFTKIEYVIGEKQTTIEDTDERIIII